MAGTAARIAAIAAQAMITEATRKDPMAIMEKCRLPDCAIPGAGIPPTPVTQGASFADIQITEPEIEMPTTAETIAMLKDRLGKELYRIELDLQNGGRIAGRPCDCLSKKHRLGIEATAEELMSYERSPVYGQIVAWLDEHAPSFDPKVIAKTPASYYQQLTPDVRDFRKQVMGTEDLGSILRGRGE
ncbi:MAG: hypothetical protein WC331_10010 [Candidatus Omnitrophota bacterium]|jgi:hypothetical protein